jgi:putative transposase
MGNPGISLQPGGYYHIFNHAVGKENVFREDENYQFFLRKFSKRITPFADVAAYCLMPNHFHFLIRIKSFEVLEYLWKDKPEKKKAKRIFHKLPIAPLYEMLDEIIVTEFANLFNSYAQAYNRKYFRQGALLKESFQRKGINDSDYLVKVICYIHNNPVDHGFAGRRENWKYSSYNATMANGKTNVLRDDVLEMFGGRDNFVYLHQKNSGGEI